MCRFVIPYTNSRCLLRIQQAVLRQVLTRRMRLPRRLRNAEQARRHQRDKRNQNENHQTAQLRRDRASLVRGAVEGVRVVHQVVFCRSFDSLMPTRKCEIDRLHLRSEGAVHADRILSRLVHTLQVAIASREETSHTQRDTPCLSRWPFRTSICYNTIRRKTS